LHSPSCPHCGHDKAWKNGHRNGQQRRLCANCGREYLEDNKDDNRKKRARGLSSREPNSLVVVAGEKQAERLVCVQNGTEKGEEMSTEQIHEKSDLLKGFPGELRAKILEFALKKINKGRSEGTVKIYLYNLRYLLRAGADLHDPQSVEQVIAQEMRWSNRTKSMLVTTYKEFLTFMGVSWEPPKYEYEEKIPFIPLESEIDQFIAGSGRTLAPFLQLLKESMARFGEAATLKWTDIDFERRIITINSPEKHSKSRMVTASIQLKEMLSQLPRRSEYVFSKKSTLATLFLKQRKRLAHKLNNPRLLKIGFHTFRHWGATMLYHRTRDPFLVQRKLGHKNIRNTQIYVHIEQALFEYQSDEFHSATAQTVEDARKLIETGFEYVTTFQDILMFRKRK